MKIRVLQLCKNVLPGAGICTAFILPAVLFLLLFFLLLWFDHRDFRERRELFMDSFKLGRESTEMGYCVAHSSIKMISAKKNSSTKKSKKRWEPESHCHVLASLQV